MPKMKHIFVNAPLEWSNHSHRGGKKMVRGSLVDVKGYLHQALDIATSPRRVHPVDLKKARRILLAHRYHDLAAACEHALTELERPNVRFDVSESAHQAEA